MIFFLDNRSLNKNLTDALNKQINNQIITKRFIGKNSVLKNKEYKPFNKIIRIKFLKHN